MKSTKAKKYKVELNKGYLSLSDGQIMAVLIERKLQHWITDKNYEDLSWNLYYPWKGYQSYSNEELITELNECFANPKRIIELLEIQRNRSKKEEIIRKKMIKEITREMKEMKEL